MPFWLTVLGILIFGFYASHAITRERVARMYLKERIVEPDQVLKYDGEFYKARHKLSDRSDRNFVVFCIALGISGLACFSILVILSLLEFWVWR